jgi:large subunit ribosomal protein L6
MAKKSIKIIINQIYNIRRKIKMSRIGNKPITVPEGVEVKIDGQKITVKGPKGVLEKEFHKNMKINLEGNVITVVRPDDQPQNRSLHGLTRTLLNNMIEGTVKGFERKLEVNGVGYRASKKGNNLLLNLGYSHPVEMEAPAGITFDVPNPNEIIVKGMDKELVGQTAAVIRTKRPPEVYRGKGIKYAEEVIRRKEGKAGKK